MNREKAIQALKEGEKFDLLIIGGGATGSGVALDAASRGLKVALVEGNDFCEGTSSRSTKMVHGGVRYLEKAVKRLDKEQYSLVKEGLHERGIFLKNAPHLAIPLSFVTPLYTWIDVPKVFIGLKLYDFLSGKMSLGKSKLLSRGEVKRRYPMVNDKKLKAGVLYYDGQFNDARMGVYILKTAAEHGAVIANHIKVVDLIKTDKLVKGVIVCDKETGNKFEIHAECVINATGPFADSVRKLDNKDAKNILKVSSGVHIVLDKRFSPPENGLMIPQTEDGRVLFVIPWEGHTLIGTTDEEANIEEHPKALDEEIEYIIRYANKYFNLGVTRSDVKSYWSGLRPLVFDPEKENTQELARTHVIKQNGTGMITITGGKWTSYRRMAEDVVDIAVKDNSFMHAEDCKTKNLHIVGGEDYNPEGYKELIKQYDLNEDVARHLNRFYGDRAYRVAEIARKGFEKRLHPSHPYIEAEIIYSVREEMGIHAADVLLRRLPLGLIDINAAGAVSGRVIELMDSELHWSHDDKIREKNIVIKRLSEAI